MIVRALAYLRAGQLAMWGWVPVFYGLGHFPLLVSVGFVLVTAWSVVFFTTGIRHHGPPPGWVVADVAVGVIAAAGVSRLFPVGDAASIHSWVLPVVAGVAVTVAVYGSWSTALAGIGLLSVAWLYGTWRDTSTANAQVVFSNCAVIVVFALVARLAARILVRAASQTDAANAVALEARHREAAAEARDHERRLQYMRLHDSVLHTLENISRGVWNVQAAQARENCQRDAEYLRGLISGGADMVPTDLGAALAGMVRDRAALGSLRINQQFGSLPARIPSEVADALVGAAREALNNAAKYAGVSEVWLTAFGDRDGGVTITVVDRGVGFDPRAPQTGLGLTRSIRHRVVEVGGTVRIDSAPGEGTSVETTWKP